SSGQTDTSTHGNTDDPGNDNTPTEDRVEIKGNSVIQTSLIAGGGYQTVEYTFEGDVLKKITLTSVSTVDIDQKAFDDLKKSLEGQGYAEIKLEGKTITAVCTDIPNSGYSFFANMDKENLKNALEGNVSGGDVAADYRIKWDDIQYIPTGMPKLADKVSEDYSDSATKSCSVTWNVLPKADMETMKGKLETWTGGTLEDMGMPGMASYMFSNDKVMITIMYSEEPMAGMAQCTVTVNDISF
ncbi:MAG: hypothetical protein PHY23_06960, partial [Oscillospiraceae bacterium]|nr:hypothetical protein [Oscillospiraceae bacterium]